MLGAEREGKEVVSGGLPLAMFHERGCVSLSGVLQTNGSGFGFVFPPPPILCSTIRIHSFPSYDSNRPRGSHPSLLFFIADFVMNVLNRFRYERRIHSRRIAFEGCDAKTR